MWGPSQRDSFREITYKVKFKYDDGDYSFAIDLMSRDSAQAKIGKVFIEFIELYLNIFNILVLLLCGFCIQSAPCFAIDSYNTYIFI
ncbi:CFA_G0016550.mRNA.1.CDS.1 [Saccharomyces cerevisiae]|nr:CFA_G0016550.mRNA.1.CDS.1 [Saccharomyces cerevisiae]CAI4450495.1 CCT_1a_G0016830.mRNA.1.CDS.1 [Saccharomyces cerevisiae]CAI7271937.1 CFA_G0016550.mRNA.1.CDS.1 [Saccharomyces cerevisiae]CAI7274462.1 CCT_1a_G0016830.mRNA.1.CDS.1 [Saccharomyces cerevisiae]